MSDEPPAVPVVCEACGTETRVPLPEVGDALDRHNERQHDGEAVAEVDPAVKERIADLAAEGLGLE
jgi:hypothetical protein